ncbi:ferritin-like domain-containing protein [Actinomadura barringtoniae]|uniref:Ferritin-like domain-containing protein n=1 Tax=Actinomadura barringtoniae TaxID=1427535 RepID=A0A939P6E8_9ACTN|nr:ferritin-like domain-containing protein [Actinomadura barringtoniae]MBO2445697.1 ferritin-like domain-containing protein [Actinomadura barringtoniae]
MTEPDWSRGARLSPALIQSLQRFQIGEAGDGANLVRKSDKAGDADYSAAVRVFIAEEQNHARMLALLLEAGGAEPIPGHWSDAIFVRLRRMLGLRTELLVLLAAEFVALTYYRALRDGTDDPLISEVAALILADEERHVPFHCGRLSGLPQVGIRLWQAFLAGTAAVAAADHAPALATLGMSRRRFVSTVMTESKQVTAALSARRRPEADPKARPTGCRYDGQQEPGQQEHRQYEPGNGHGTRPHGEHARTRLP